MNDNKKSKADLMAELKLLRSNLDDQRQTANRWFG